MILLIQLLWQTGSYSHTVTRWTKERYAHAPVYIALFIHSQASEQGPSKLLSQEKAFFCENCCFLPAVQWTSAGGLRDGLYSTVVLSHCSKLDDFFPSYMCRSQDFLSRSLSALERRVPIVHASSLAMSTQIPLWAILLSWWKTA